MAMVVHQLQLALLLSLHCFSAVWVDRPADFAHPTIAASGSTILATVVDDLQV